MLRHGDANARSLGEKQVLKHVALALAVSAPVAAVAAPHEIDATCGQSVRAFFAPLIQQNLINRKPARVSGPSVNHFLPHFLKPLTAFNLPVVEVFGYTNDPLLFVSSQPGEDVYGVVVRDGIGNVQAQLDSIGARGARVMRVDQKTTLIMCKGEI